MKSKCIIDQFGDKRWYNRKGNLHREDGPALEYANGDKCWFINGQYHRVDGPALEWNNGDKEWYINGKRHREDGPAYEGPDGKEWFYHGEWIEVSSQKEFEKYLRLKMFW